MTASPTLLHLLRHRALQRLWGRLQRLSLVGMNYWSSDLHQTGELDVLDYVFERMSADAIIFDVGGNVGDYSAAVLKRSPAVKVIHAFEPSSATAALFEDRMREIAGSSGRVQLHRLALSDRNGLATLNTAGAGSATASLHQLSPTAMDSVPHDPSRSEQVELITLDEFCKAHGVDRIGLLKIDAEGHEPMVLRGARSMLASGAVQFVQFEFGAFNIDSRTYLRDIFDLLEGYRISRIVPGGLVPLGEYHPRLEQFATMNYLAERR